MQTGLRQISGLAILVFFLIGFSIHMTRPDYGQCDFFEKELNGGRRNLEVWNITQSCPAQIFEMGMK
ncbi:hypothetical protein [Burkholderia cenocepacia]|uniref:hypothetical protein n=1 Tax=Burkholderia cenocepacia TaxID=95486 RepID=UPI002AB16B22|nr:hypothetical protein [Burkholderia cenocepacia]